MGCISSKPKTAEREEESISVDVGQSKRPQGGRVNNETPIEGSSSARKVNQGPEQVSTIAKSPKEDTEGKLTSRGSAVLPDARLKDNSTAVAAANLAASAEAGRLIRTRGKIEVLGFEVANVIVRAINLRQSLLDRDIEDLHNEVLASEGIHMLVSDDMYHVWGIAAEDKRCELRSIARDVARIGQHCLDPSLHDLGSEFENMGRMFGNGLSTEEADKELLALESQAKITAELYHELVALDSMVHALKQQEAHSGEGSYRDEDMLLHMRAEVTAQERMVFAMKRKGLWHQNMDEVVKLLVAIVMFLQEEITRVFGPEGMNKGSLLAEREETEEDRRKLGVNGMALQYANIVMLIDTMVMKPNEAKEQREALFAALPRSVASRVKPTLMQSQDILHESTESIRQKLEAVLDWLVTMSENTIRYGMEMRVQGHTDLTLLQTLYHVDEGRMERLCLLLLVGLQHLLSRRLLDWDPIPRAPTIAQMVHEHGQEGEEGEVSPHVEAGEGEGEGEGEGTGEGESELEAYDQLLEHVRKAANEEVGVKDADTATAAVSSVVVADTNHETEVGKLLAEGDTQPSEDVQEAALEIAKPVVSDAAVTAGGAAAAAAADDSSVTIAPATVALLTIPTAPRPPARAVSSPRKKKPDLKLLTSKAPGSRSRRMGSDGVPDGLPSPLNSTNKRRASLEVVTREQWSALGAPKPAPEGGGLKMMFSRSHSEGEEEPVKAEAQRTAAAGTAAGAAVAGSGGPGAGRSVSFSSSAGAAAAMAALSGAGPLSLTVDIAKPASLSTKSLSLRGLAEVPENEELPETPAAESGDKKKRDLSFLRDETSPKMREVMGEKKLSASERAELLAAMTKSQGFGPKAKGPVGDMFAAALQEAVTGRSRSQAFSATGKQETEHFFSRTLSRTRLHALEEDDEPKEQRWMSMAPSKVDVDLIGDIAPGVKMEKFSF